MGLRARGGRRALADWGAEVIKVEHPVTGDPQRGLMTSGIMGGGGVVNFMTEMPNRGKRSIGLDIRSEEGLELLYKLAETSDVFLTSFLPAARQTMRIDVEPSGARPRHHLRARQRRRPARARAPSRGGFDAAVYSHRVVVTRRALTPPEAPTTRRAPPRPMAISPAA